MTNWLTNDRSNVSSWIQLSSLRSGHRRLTGSPTSEEQQSSSQPSPSGASSVSNASRTSSTDSKSDSTKRPNKVGKPPSINPDSHTLSQILMWICFRAFCGRL